MKVLLITLLGFTMIACQTAPKHGQKFKREIANASLFRKFIEGIADNSTATRATLEKKVIAFIKTEEDGVLKNLRGIGISESQARSIRTLNDDLPFMPKVQKWVMENINKVDTSIDTSTARRVYDEIIVNNAYVYNPYTRATTLTTMSRVSGQSSPQSAILKKYISDIESTTYKARYTNVLKQFEDRSANEAGVLANGTRIVESAAEITHKTGKAGMGAGCESFIKTASRDVLSAKADVDIRRAELIRQEAFAKAGRSFASVDELAENLRLTSSEIDTQTKKAMQDVLGYTDDEAKVALQRLKKAPCKLY